MAAGRGFATVLKRGRALVVTATVFALLAAGVGAADAAPTPVVAAAAAPAGSAAPVAPVVDAAALKQQAIALVESMQYPNPDVTPPGKDFRKEEILQALRAASEGPYRDATSLGGSVPFNQDIAAATRLEQLIADPKNTADVKSKASAALDLVVKADRLLATDLVAALALFPQPYPASVKENVSRGTQELAKGDDRVAKQQRSSAILNYAKAYGYVDSAGKGLFTAYDADGDKLLPAQETRAGTDPAKADTDGDGLSDSDEINRTGTNPLIADTGNTGTTDGQRDPDGDGLSNIQEIAAGTKPLRADTDGDTLSDGREKQLATNPLKRDTDDDGLSDPSELRLSTNPTNPDTDGDTIKDGYETYTTSASSADSRVSVQLTGIGDVAGNATFKDLSQDLRFKAVPGQIGSPVDITVPGQFSAASLTFTYDPATVPGADVQNLRIAYYDEGLRTFLPLDVQTVDPAKRTIRAVTTHFSTYVLFYIPNWNQVWTQTDGDPRGTGTGETKNLDVMLVLDSSGSMTYNDPANIRLSASKQFIDALIPGDQVGVVDFDDYARLASPLTADFAKAKAAVDTVDSYGGTNIGAGVLAAENELDTRAKPEHLKAIILLTDGDGYYDPSLTTRAKSAGVTIYTIGLGPGVKADVLQGIAAGTGGIFIPVSSADGLPQVFRRIAGNGVDLTDTDGDGLPDVQERNGIRICTGEVIKTDPALKDTDGDGLTDLEELGQLQSVPAGSCYGPVSNPLAVDTDGDGLLDDEETDIGTNPYLYDTDGDTLGDGFEVDEIDFNPLAANADGDSRRDDEEYRLDSDPDYRDLEGFDNFTAVLAGAVWGDSGEWAMKWGLLDRETFESLSYLGGWLASGYFVVGDIRDTFSALFDARWGTAVLSAVALVPIAGDAVKTGAVVRKFVAASERMRLPVTKWITRQFADYPAVRKVLYKIVGAESGLDKTTDEILDSMAKGRCDMNIVAKALNTGRVTLARTVLRPDQEARISAAVARWGTNLSARLKAEAVAVETAVEILQDQGYKILYVGRPKPINMANKAISQGPDIVAISPAGVTTVVEAKGALSKVSANNTKLTSKVNNVDREQPGRDWLSTNANSRYLDAMKATTDTAVQEAARRLSQIIDNNGEFEGVVVAAAQSARIGKIDKSLKTFTKDPLMTTKVIAVDITVP